MPTHFALAAEVNSRRENKTNKDVILYKYNSILKYY
jgi:hypothetical protein